MPSLVEGCRDTHRKLKLNIFVSRRYMNKRALKMKMSAVRKCAVAQLYTLFRSSKFCYLLVNCEYILTWYQFSLWKSSHFINIRIGMTTLSVSSSAMVVHGSYPKREFWRIFSISLISPGGNYIKIGGGEARSASVCVVISLNGYAKRRQNPLNRFSFFSSKQRVFNASHVNLFFLYLDCVCTHYMRPNPIHSRVLWQAKTPYPKWMSTLGLFCHI